MFCYLQAVKRTKTQWLKSKWLLMVLSKASAFVDSTTGLPAVGKALDMKV